MTAFNPEREVRLDGVGLLRFDYARLAQLAEEVGEDFDVQLGAIVAGNKVELLSRFLAVGTGRPYAEIYALSPPVIPAFQAVLKALNLAYYGAGAGPDASVPEADPAQKKSRLFPFGKLWRKRAGSPTGPA